MCDQDKKIFFNDRPTDCEPSPHQIEAQRSGFDLEATKSPSGVWEKPQGFFHHLRAYSELVDDNGLEPLTLRTSSECSTS